MADTPRPHPRDWCELYPAALRQTDIEIEIDRERERERERKRERESWRQKRGMERKTYCQTKDVAVKFPRCSKVAHYKRMRGAGLRWVRSGRKGGRRSVAQSEGKKKGGEFL